MVEYKVLAIWWTSSCIKRSHSQSRLITELIICTSHKTVKFLSMIFSNHCSFRTSVGTTIKTESSGVFLLKSSIMSNATFVLPNPVQYTQVPDPEALSHRLIPSFCRSVRSILMNPMI